MLRLIRLELSKFKIRKYIIFSIIIAVGMCFFATIAIAAASQDNAVDYEKAIKLTNAAITDCYLIFGAMLVIKVIVEEYLKKTISVLFTYSVDRNKLMLSKVLLVMIITVSAWVVTEIISILYLGIVGNHLDFILSPFGFWDLKSWLMQFVCGFLMMLSLMLLLSDVAFIKRTGQYVFMASIISVVIVQIIISQSLEVLIIPLVLLSALITIVSVNRYSVKIE